MTETGVYPGWGETLRSLQLLLVILVSGPHGHKSTFIYVELKSTLIALKLCQYWFVLWM